MSTNNTTYVSQLLTANGGANGILTVTDTSNFRVGAVVYLSSSSVATKSLFVDAILSGTELAVKDTQGYTYNRYNSSAYLVADVANVTQPVQEDYYLDGVTPGTVIVADEGVEQGSAYKLNFTGSGATATYSGGTATIDITGGGGGGGSVTSVSGTSPINVVNGTSTPVVSINTANFITAFKSTYNSGLSDANGIFTYIDTSAANSLFEFRNNTDTATYFLPIINAYGITGGTPVSDSAGLKLSIRTPVDNSSVYGLHILAQSASGTPLTNSPPLRIETTAGTSLLSLAPTGALTILAGLTGATGAFSGRVTSSVASGSVAYSQLTGARLVTNGGTDTRYISDSGSAIAFTGAVTMSSTLAITGALSGVTSLSMGGALSGATTGAFSGTVTSSVVSGSVAYSQLQGARFTTNGGTNTRYISDDGTNITFTGPVSTSSSLAITGALSGATTGAFSGEISSTVASGSRALSVLSGARVVFNSGTNTSYLSWDGTFIASPVPMSIVGNPAVFKVQQTSSVDNAYTLWQNSGSGRLDIGVGGAGGTPSGLPYIQLTSGNDLVWLDGSQVEKMRFNTTGTLFSKAASAAGAFQMNQGARFYTNGATATRYVSDDGTNITFTGPVSTSSSLAITGALSGATTGAFSGRVTSSVASGSFAYSQLTGARFSTNGGTDTRYISDDGTNITITGPVSAANTITSTVASGSNAFTVATGARIGTASQYLSYAAAGVQMPASINFLSDNIRQVSATTSLKLFGTWANAANAIAVSIESGVAYTTAGSKLLRWANNGTEVGAVYKDGQFVFPTGNANSVVGTATLVAGTVTVNTTAVTANSIIFLTVNTPGGTQGFISAPVASITAATSFVINSSSALDTSTVNWLITN